MLVLLHHPGGIGQWHRPAGKGAETRARLFMARSEGKLLQCFVHALSSSRSCVAPAATGQRGSAPLCRKPERLAAPPGGTTYTFGAGTSPDFPESFIRT